MDVFDAIFKRKTVRKFIKKDVPDDLIRKIIEAGTHAPNACNLQRWKFIILKDKKVIDRLIEYGTAYFLKDIPVGILVLYDNRIENKDYQDHFQSAAACIQNMLLAATELGLGSCWVANLPPQKIMRKLFDIPWNYDVVAYVGFGYYEEEPTKKERADINTLISYEKFGFGEKAKKLDFKRKIKVVARNLYQHTPLPIKKCLHPIARKFEKKF